MLIIDRHNIQEQDFIIRSDWEEGGRMQLRNLDAVSCDVLVIGGGGASLRAALEASEMGAHVMIASKTRVGYTNNTYISGGIIAVPGIVEGQDTRDSYLKDTVTSGRFLNDQKLVALLADEAKAQVAFLEDHGASFTRKDGALAIQHVWP